VKLYEPSNREYNKLVLERAVVLIREHLKPADEFDNKAVAQIFFIEGLLFAAGVVLGSATNADVSGHLFRASLDKMHNAMNQGVEAGLQANAESS